MVVDYILVFNAVYEDTEPQGHGHGMHGSGPFGGVGRSFGNDLSGIGDREGTTKWRDGFVVDARDGLDGRSSGGNGGDDGKPNGSEQG